ncbi:hypothetical protein HK096_001210, partial [Nowakowskiella sp. JEL0078]
MRVTQTLKCHLQNHALPLRKKPPQCTYFTHCTPFKLNLPICFRKKTSPTPSGKTTPTKSPATSSKLTSSNPGRSQTLNNFEKNKRASLIATKEREAVNLALAETEAFQRAEQLRATLEAEAQAKEYAAKEQLEREEIMRDQRVKEVYSALDEFERQKEEAIRAQEEDRVREIERKEEEAWKKIAEQTAALDQFERQKQVEQEKKSLAQVILEDEELARFAERAGSLSSVEADRQEQILKARELAQEALKIKENEAFELAKAAREKLEKQYRERQELLKQQRLKEQQDAEWKALEQHARLGEFELQREQALKAKQEARQQELEKLEAEFESRSKDMSEIDRKKEKLALEEERKRAENAALQEEESFRRAYLVKIRLEEEEAKRKSAELSQKKKEQDEADWRILEQYAKLDEFE